MDVASAHNARHKGERLAASPSHAVAELAGACYVDFVETIEQYKPCN
jgi:hypothetical protein